MPASEGICMYYVCVIYMHTYVYAYMYIHILFSKMLLKVVLLTNAGSKPSPK